jgi:hypothetical protein
MFDGLDRTHVESLASQSRLNFLPAGQVLFRRGTPPPASTWFAMAACSCRCPPPPMIDAGYAALTAVGVPREQIHAERFSAVS